MRKTIGTAIGAVAISLCIFVSFYSAAQGERQRKVHDGQALYYAIKSKAAVEAKQSQVSETYPRSRSEENARS